MTNTSISLAALRTETIRIPIVGTSPLIVHKWSEKAKRQMLDAQQGRKMPKEKRDSVADYEASMYRMPNGYGFPAVAFKAATVDGGYQLGAAKKTELRAWLFFQGEMHPEFDEQQLVPIEGTPRMREDVVTVGVKGTDLRYRGEFTEWRSVLTVRYMANRLDAESVVSLVNAGGLTIGVGEWRPARDGDFGMYQVDPDGEIEIRQ